MEFKNIEELAEYCNANSINSITEDGGEYGYLTCKGHGDSYVLSSDDSDKDCWLLEYEKYKIPTTKDKKKKLEFLGSLCDDLPVSLFNFLLDKISLEDCITAVIKEWRVCIYDYHIEGNNLHTIYEV